MVGTVGRLILVQPAVSSAAGWLLTYDGETQYWAFGWNRNSLRSPVSCVAVGTYWYGSMPAACTRPSQM